jgi:hypothetical protein
LVLPRRSRRVIQPSFIPFRFASWACGSDLNRSLSTTRAADSNLRRGASSLVQLIDGINSCLPDLPVDVRFERNIMARNLLMHTCADLERALAEGTSMPRPSWRAAATGLIDAVVGLWLAPVTPASEESSR